MSRGFASDPPPPYHRCMVCKRRFDTALGMLRHKEAGLGIRNSQRDSTNRFQFTVRMQGRSDQLGVRGAALKQDVFLHQNTLQAMRPSSSPSDGMTQPSLLISVRGRATVKLEGSVKLKKELQWPLQGLNPLPSSFSVDILYQISSNLVKYSCIWNIWKGHSLPCWLRPGVSTGPR
jgi:hypothetical protein